MSMDPQQCLPSPRFVQHNIIRSHELPRGRDVEAYPEHVTIIDGVWIGIADAECGDAGAGPVEVLLVVCQLCSAG